MVYINKQNTKNQILQYLERSKGMVNVNLLKSRMVYCDKKQADLAKELNLSQSTTNQKINNLRKITIEEAFKIKKFLNIPDDEFEAYFFAK